MCRQTVSLAIALCIVCLPLVGCSSPTTSNTTKDESAPTALPPAPARSSESPDVIVVGAGTSGLAAALDLGRGGAKVTVVDMSSVFGGHAVMSQGSISIVATPVQERAGIHDSPNLAFQDIHRWGEN